MGCQQSSTIQQPSASLNTVHTPSGNNSKENKNRLPVADSSNSQSNHPNSANVIVIGSGMAGMAAAATLIEAGMSVIVLQANNYIGGRTKTVNIPLSNGINFAFDEGASWIHGSTNQHPITQLAKQMGNVKSIETQDDSIEIHDQKGEDCNQEVERQFQNYQKFMKQCQKFQNKSIYEALQKISPQKLKNPYFMFNVSNDIEFQTSASIQNLSAEFGQQDNQFEGKQMLIVNGYQALSEYLLQKNRIQVLLSHEVKQINLAEQKLLITCANKKIFTSDYVVCAVPIGVLKSKKIKFTPSLPSWKQKAINNIKFGNVCKVLINLKKDIVRSNKHYIGVVSNNVEKRGLATYFLNLKAIAGLPALMTFGLGPNATELENMPQNELKQLIAKRLNSFLFEKAAINSNDFTISRTKWQGNSNFQGAYSYSGVETTKKDWQNMAKPLFEQGIYFCGQHTYSKYRGTVHGAYLSGVFAAKNIIKGVEQKDWSQEGAVSDDQEESKSKEEENHQKIKQKESSNSSKNEEKESKKKKKKESSQESENEGKGRNK